MLAGSTTVQALEPTALQHSAAAIKRMRPVCQARNTLSAAGGVFL